MFAVSSATVSREKFLTRLSERRHAVPRGAHAPSRVVVGAPANHKKARERKTVLEIAFATIRPAMAQVGTREGACASRKKHQAPTSKPQRSSKFQAPIRVAQGVGRIRALPRSAAVSVPPTSRSTLEHTRAIAFSNALRLAFDTAALRPICHPGQ